MEKLENKYKFCCQITVISVAIAGGEILFSSAVMVAVPVFYFKLASETRDDLFPVFLYSTLVSICQFFTAILLILAHFKRKPNACLPFLALNIGNVVFLDLVLGYQFGFVNWIVWPVILFFTLFEVVICFVVWKSRNYLMEKVEISKQFDFANDDSPSSQKPLIKQISV
uniref:Transmembrane protein n=1 Tax=Panagrolaimus sp. JU765 TaxID=591449 RepID=A0AC34Q402_9BILA